MTLLRNVVDNCTILPYKKRVSYKAATFWISKLNSNENQYQHSPDTFEKGLLLHQQTKLILSKIDCFAIPHLYKIWKIVKNPQVGRPIIAGYNWILTPASIFVGHFLKEFYIKFDSIL